MKKFMNWLSTVFAPKMNEICSKPWIAAVSSSMQKIIPFILTGSVIYFYNVFRSYLPALPDLGMIADYSFGLISLILAFVVGQQCMEKLNHPFYLTNCGIVSMAVFMMFIIPGTDEAGNMVIQGGRLGATGIAVGIVAGLFTSIIFNLYSKLHVLEDSTSIPDFVVGWINYILPTLITLGLGMVLTKYCNFDIFEIVLWIFSPLAGFAQTMPGFILCCFIPAVLYSMGISSWLFGAVTTPIFLAGIQENINMVAQGLPATNIATSETVFTAALVTMGGMGATLALNVLMCFSKSKQLKTLGRIFIGPSIFNINEPIMFGAPVVFNQAMQLLKQNGRFGPVGRPVKDLTVSVKTYETILRRQLTIKGTWSFEFKRFPHNAWDISLEALQKGIIQTDAIISHRFPLSKTKEAVEVMAEKKEFFYKILIVPEMKP